MAAPSTVEDISLDIRNWRAYRLGRPVWQIHTFADDRGLERITGRGCKIDPDRSSDIRHGAASLMVFKLTLYPALLAR
jgi:hypothetical protein